MSDQSLPKTHLQGTSLPAAHNAPQISIPDAHTAVTIAALQKHLRDLRAQQVSDTHLPGNEQAQRSLSIEINSALEVLHHLGAQEAPAQA